MEKNTLYKSVECYNYFHDKIVHDFRFYKNEVKGKILDLGCGTGRVTDELSKYFPDITGLDISKTFIESNKKRMPYINWVEGDILSYKSEDKYDSIIFPINGIAHFNSKDELETLFDNCYNNLQDNGIMIFDFSNINHSSLKEKEIEHVGKEHFFRRRIKDNRIELKMANDQHSGRVELFLWQLEDIIDIFSYKFEIQKLYGSFEKEKYDFEKSKYCIFILKKK